MNTLTDSQKLRFNQDPEYTELNAAIQNLVQFELLNLVKAKIENTAEGKELLNKQLSVVKRLKKAVVQETDNEMAIFNKFKEVSKNNPNLTYDEFVKQWRNM